MLGQLRQELSSLGRKREWKLVGENALRDQLQDGLEALNLRA